MGYSYATVMILTSALRVMQLLLAYNKEDSQPIEQVFNEKEINCLKAINETLQVEPEKVKTKIIRLSSRGQHG